MAKNLIILFDGTWVNSLETDSDSNIHWLGDSIAKRNQVKFYHSGVGEKVGKLNRTIYGATGKGVFSAVREGWNNIYSNYEDGDKIYIFGFSRGAYSAKHLASMIVRYGLQAYKGRLEATFEDYIATSNTPCTLIRQTVHFLGMFDCVPGNDLYMLKDRSFHLNSPILEDGILNVRHAVAEHERRYSFRPLLFEHGSRSSFKQCWFPGFHSDVGGHKDNARGLASFSLWWMIREAYGLGLDFDNINCPLHQGGSSLNVIRAIDLNDKPVSSDYPTTKFGLIWDRKKKVDSIVPDPTPLFSDLVACPRCPNNMFDISETEPARDLVRRLMNKP